LLHFQKKIHCKGDRKLLVNGNNLNQLQNNCKSRGKDMVEKGLFEAQNQLFFWLKTQKLNSFHTFLIGGYIKNNQALAVLL